MATKSVEQIDGFLVRVILVDLPSWMKIDLCLFGGH